ncbi:MAG: hypothetical protein HYX42_04020 [Polaromonas sp.]|uniref:hypothetical protein n=1 Tax=Polaromonas sp. TaxID=1869339 RepID=UPI0025DF364E|nr:hypothetical protein [Polaromonas sp.]MBI2725397.1 hypothetical protein [Polaromonas sp.]
MRSGQKVAFFMVKGNEIHCMRGESHKGRWLTRQDLERLTAPIFREYGHLTTKVSSHNSAGQRFVRRLGFYALSDDGTNIYFRAERLNHARL